MVPLPIYPASLAFGSWLTQSNLTKLKQTQFERANPQFKGKDFTFKTQTGKSESNKERYKRIQKENTKAFKGMIDRAFKR